MDTVKLGIGEIKFSESFEQHNNVSIICGDGVKVRANSLLLASISPWLYKLIKEQCHEEEITIITPDIQSQNVSHLMRNIQTNLTSNSCTECVIDENTFKTLLKPNPEMKLPFCKVDFVDIKCENEVINLKEDGSIQNDEDLVTKLEFDDFDSSTIANDDHYECEDDEIDSKTNSNYSQILDSSLSDTLLDPIQNIEKTKPSTLTNGTCVKKKVKKEIGKTVNACDQCEYKSLRKSNLARHVQKVHESKNENRKTVYACNHCEYKSLKKSNLAGHVQKVHESKKRRGGRPKNDSLSHLCPFCGEDFKTENGADRKGYHRHISKHKLDQFSCDCQETWDSNAEKERHMKVKHMGYSQCSQCLECFKTEDALALHMEKKHSENANNSKIEENAVCHQCGKSFQSKDSLHIHMQYVHNKETSHCDECGKDFEGPYRLKDHQRNVHRPKPCPICGAIFQNINVHMHTVHREEKDKKHVCHICGKGFPLKQVLDCHNMSVHIKARPYSCRYGCSFSYNDRRNRNAHERKKHGGLFTGKNCTLSI